MNAEISKTPGRRSSRDRLLDAATTLVGEHGVQQLTIEAVAAAAGVTKSGFIYHFKTRDELLGALVERMVVELEAHHRAQATAADGSTQARSLVQALVGTTFDMSDADKRVFTQLLAAASSHPHLMGPAQASFARVYADLQALGGHQAPLALVLAAALDGISLLELLNLHHFSDAQRQAMRQAVSELAQQLA